jgi:PD-(D/E)XK nuclease family transposase
MKKKEKKIEKTVFGKSPSERYVNPFTDLDGSPPLRFKKLFGSELHKDLLISFLNEILPDQKIATLTYKKTENLGATDLDRKVIYDLYCENDEGEKFIVELQKACLTAFSNFDAENLKPFLFLLFRVVFRNFEKRKK